VTELPFTVDEFLGVFAAYNRALIIGAAGLWFVAVGVLIGAARHPGRASRALSLFFAALWGWNAVAYHALFFTSINPAAWLFAAAFLLQAILFAVTYRHVEYFAAAGLREWTGVALVLYALAYPLLTVASGHEYPATPTFGVPCPTAILTIGALMTAPAGPPLRLAVIPALWAFIGGSAAILLRVPTDYVLLAAGLVLTLLLVRRITFRRPRPPDALTAGAD
jgi:hypothetical protein